MRIISGTHRGRPINVLKDFTDRPTTDIAKEGLINILNNMYYLEDFTVLDLFAGTGNVSFELASNGVINITAVDNNAKYMNFLENQADEFFPDIAFNTITADVFEFVKKYPLSFDIIFADPPYDLPNIDTIPDLIFANKDIPNDALLILEHSKKYNFNEHKFFLKEKKYGKVHFTFFTNENDKND